MRRLRVKPHERLIHQNQLRIVQPGGNNGQLLLHTVGIGGDGGRKVACQLEQIAVFLYAFLPLCRVNAENIRDEVQVLNPRHKVVEIRVVRNISKTLFAGDRVLADGDAADQDVAGIKPQNSRNGFQRSGFSGAVMADKTVDFARQDVQRKIIDRGFVPVGLGQMLNLQHVIFLLFMGAALYRNAAVKCEYRKNGSARGIEPRLLIPLCLVKKSTESGCTPP